MTAIAVAHHVPYVAQAAGVALARPEREGRARRGADGPAFLNVLTDCPVGWGHEPRARSAISERRRRQLLLAAVRGRRRRLPAHVPAAADHARRGLAALAEALRAPLPSGNEAVLTEIQRRVDDEWDALLERCGETAQPR